MHSAFLWASAFGDEIALPPNLWDNGVREYNGPPRRERAGDCHAGGRCRANQS